MTDLAEWLLQQITEDEVFLGPLNRYEPSDLERGPDGIAGAQRRILAECAAKRKIVEHAQHWLNTHGDDNTENATFEGCAITVLGYLAEPYADRPGYQQEWRP